MRLFHLAQPLLEGGTLYLPYAIRAGLGWHDRRLLYCWTRRLQPSPASQISLSAIKPNEREVWTLRLQLHDRRGILAELTRLLAEQHVNILTCRSSTHVQNLQFGVEMEIDTHEYHPSTRNRDPALRELRARIACRFITELVFDGRRPSLRLERNQLLNNLSDVVVHDDARLENGMVTLPREPLGQLRGYVSRYYIPIKARSGESAEPLVLLVADTDAGVVDASVYYRHTGHIHVRFLAEDRIGTLEKIARTLNEFQFNILQVYHRTVELGHSSETDLFLYYPIAADADLVEDRELIEKLRYVASVPAMKDIRAVLYVPGIAQPPPREFTWNHPFRM